LENSRVQSDETYDRRTGYESERNKRLAYAMRKPVLQCWTQEPLRE